MKEDLKKYSIWIVNSIEKNKLLKNNTKLNNIKLITLEELKKKYYFTYQEEAIYYLMKKKSYQYDVAKMYLSHLTEVTEKIKNTKTKRLLQIKEELEKNNLLIKNSLLKDYLKNKNILFFNLTNITKQDKKILDELSNNNNIYYYEEEKEIYQHKSIYVAKTKESEVVFAANEIVKLIKNNIDIKKIKLYASEYYIDSIERIFKWFHIPVQINNNSLYETSIGKTLLDNLTLSKEELLKTIEENYPLNKSNNLDIYNQIINIINSYTWCNNLKELEPFLKEKLKNTIIEQPRNINTISIINSLKDTEEDDYIFLLGFNQGEIPISLKDEDYFNDEEKKILNIDTTDELNELNQKIWLEQINHTKNLTITMKTNNEKGECYISNLNDILKLEPINIEEDYTRSNLYNQLELSKKLDILTKYNELEKDIGKLYQHYKDIPYRTYNNNYTRIEANKIKKYLNNELVLSYSSMNSFYQCSFKYYLTNILKINIFEESFYTILGNLFHHILSLYYREEINIKEEYEKEIERIDYPFNERELYFLNHLEKELEFIIETINEQNKNSKLTNITTEEKVEIDSTYEDMHIIFKGFIDKIIKNEEENKLAIIDYKTGTPNLNLNQIIHGLDLQLPVYIYLTKHKNPNARIAGFYLQKILNNEITKDKKHSYIDLKKENLKLQGYTNKDISLLSELDPDYANSNMIKGMRLTSKGISSQKLLDDIQIEKLVDITKEKINNSIKEICSANFDINPKRIGMDNVGCKYCNFKDICFKTEKNILTLKEYKNMEFLGGEDNDTTETN